MSRIAAEALVERLVDWDFYTVFGLPGDEINGIMEGLRRPAQCGNWRRQPISSPRRMCPERATSRRLLMC